MTDLTPYPDVEAAIRALLLRDFTEITQQKQVAVDWPADNQPLPFVRVEELPLGRVDKLTYHPVVEIEVLATTRAAAKALIRKINDRMLDYPLSVVIGSETIVIDMVTVPVVPAQRPWDSPDVRRYAGTYQLSVRR